MMDQRIENLLNMSLSVTPQEREKSPDLESGYNKTEETWEIIVKYIGNIEDLKLKYPEIKITRLLNQYAVIVTPERYVEEISKEPYIEFVEKPKRMYFEIINGKRESCITSVQTRTDNRQGLFGKGVIVAVIDTGIDATSQEFRNKDGTTRILNIWDQSTNIEYDRTQINNALKEGRFLDIPGRDFVGHGTDVSIIACGGSGVASQSDIIVVKMGLAQKDSFPRTTQLMEAVDYVVRKGIEYDMPVAINISFGNNYGDHTGSTFIETFMNDISRNWKTSICVGSGNEGLGATHAGGSLKSYDEKIVEVAISSYETSVNIQIWKDYWDDLNVEIITPSGKNLGKIDFYNRIERKTAEGTIILSLYGEPSPYSLRQEIYIDMIPKDEYIAEGIWKIKITSGKVVSGRYDMWLPAIGALNKGTGFTQPDSSMSITIPSTAEKVITVGAYNSKTDTAAPFSGRGFVAMIGGTTIAKPEIVAPGVDIFTTEFNRSTGTSFATPFVTGSAALLMEWGIIKGNDPYLYGDKVKAYLIKGARQLPGYEMWPNPQLGWGALCVKDSLPL
ncbi:MAG: S8 family serine peptidase [Lachnospiraceae bacterium]|nr:S8 family serine peptidase [Lachnospiraceae bacterium]